MGIIKNNFKSILLVFITSIICISGTVFATSYFASDISYTKEGWNGVNTVEDAIDNLYDTQKNVDNFCFYGNGSSTNQSWTGVGFSLYETNNGNCQVNSSQIVVKKDMNITIKYSLFAGRRSNGTTNTGYLRVLVDGSVVATGTGVTNNSYSVYTLLSNYSVTKDSVISFQVQGTDSTGKMVAIYVSKDS